MFLQKNYHSSYCIAKQYILTLRLTMTLYSIIPFFYYPSDGVAMSITRPSLSKILSLFPRVPAPHKEVKMPAITRTLARLFTLEELRSLGSYSGKYRLVKIC